MKSTAEVWILSPSISVLDMWQLTNDRPGQGWVEKTFVYAKVCWNGRLLLFGQTLPDLTWRIIEVDIQYF